MTTQFKLLSAAQHTAMLLELQKAIEICENAHPVPWDEYDNVEPTETYPGAVGYTQATLMSLKGTLERAEDII